ncbi:DUF262 domain-containing protein [Zobellia sp. 1_MG-2023]|uniref:GmrSD restriction endonuclease domain-containing protein n=1 Tax=Zobellia sp. 1_MG-2023 TaxID=3062626 RepID=UPI0026E29310|nr:DUF262 domain-containing protein [Zobellia sp. 1_MG-2023]MDO6819457.1 DUF262 domain-containing protein [Zobellia sp. 1_MG-2023]
MGKVNLDAIIPREDFEVEENQSPGKKKETISIEDIKTDSFFFINIRKPDFQRETNEWDEKKISQFVKSFVEGDLIPAIILWRSSGGYLFVIDGSHRLSSLSAWVNDDYGDGDISKMFYDGQIPEEQLQIAEKTRKKVNALVGSYKDYKLALTHPQKVKPEIVSNSKNLGALAIQLQWVEGDATKAENSFFKINQQAAPIDKTELTLLKTRRFPNSIAARAIIRSGKGHKYWSKFTLDIQKEIQEYAEKINDVLFNPKLDTPIKTLDIPIGGKLYAAATLPLILDFVNIANDINTKSNLNEDIDGSETIRILKRTLKIARLINSNHPSSLGLHPVIYFYSKDGRHKTALFYSIINFVIDIEKRKKLNDFIKVRAGIENIIWNYDYLIQQINRKYRSAQASYPHISSFLKRCMELLNEEKSEFDVIKLLSQSEYDYLTIESKEFEETSSSDFNTNRKSAVYIKDAIESAPKCKICGGLIHRNAISIDHIDRKEDGGLGTVDNGQLTHPYCNTGYKN